MNSQLRQEDEVNAETATEVADGCGCQYDASGHRFRSRCICPDPPTPEQTLRGIAGRGGAVGDAVRGVLAERDNLREQRVAALALTDDLPAIIRSAAQHPDGTADMAALAVARLREALGAQS